jgi:hypothetical protein
MMTAGGGKLRKKGSGKMLKGLKTKAPASSDSSSNTKSGSMNSGSTRSKVAKTPSTLGPRRA